MKTVRIYGTAKNIRHTPPAPQGSEVWLSNSPGTFEKRHPKALLEWTRWFNLHSKKHILATYPSGWKYFQEQTDGRPVYLQKTHEDVPTSKVFPRDEIQNFFATSTGPNRYFVCTVCWLIALAIFEGFRRIELWGFELKDTKPGERHAFERPCVWYWIKQARDRGIDVVYQKELTRLPFEPGDAETYVGPLYGYETKPEE